MNVCVRCGGDHNHPGSYCFGCAIISLKESEAVNFPDKLTPGPSPITRPVHVRPGFEALHDVLTGALHQAQDGTPPTDARSGMLAAIIATARAVLQLEGKE